MKEQSHTGKCAFEYSTHRNRILAEIETEDLLITYTSELCTKNRDSYSNRPVYTMKQDTQLNLAT